jgi:hypothetical protein
MNFKCTINESAIRLKDFLNAVKKYDNIDNALENLPDDYIEFYFKNMNSNVFNNKLKQMKLVESESEFEPYITQMGGASPKSGKYKKIRYKGEFIILKYDERWGWVPYMSFRSITQATQYIKKMADGFM